MVAFAAGVSGFDRVLEPGRPRPARVSFPGSSTRESTPARNSDALGGGQRNKIIADQLQISVKTVEAHRARMMGKLAIHSTVELIRGAIEEGVLDGEAEDPGVKPH
ncbi:MAG TPA: LuxR C-terminal-related transcriptional regulator [Bryobacteraceae bacterium]|nr:LuxR C-terminal-related transcriptional regulator [Bryobacteraceae bacterium]